MKELAVYIHIPFCKSKCHYCDFLSFSNKNELMDKYFDYLNREIALYSEMVRDYSVKTVFLGGGTPSNVEPKYIFDILNSIHKKFNIDKVNEVTIEVNPKTVNEDKLRIYKSIGINRISMGAQTLNDDLLKEIGRVHTVKDFYDSFNLIRSFGFENLNIDLMFNLPKQTLSDVVSTLEVVSGLDVEHISFYSLILEEGTRFYKRYSEGRLDLPDEELEREMYHRGIKVLKSHGYKHYEISNFAKPSYECKHNLFYWKVKPYIGLGLGAHSNINGLRYWNEVSFENYFDSLENRKLPIDGSEKIDNAMEMAEYLILGLRLVDGVKLDDFYDRFHISIDSIYGSVLKKHEKSGLICNDGDRIRLTSKGLDLANIVFVDLLPNQD